MLDLAAIGQTLFAKADKAADTPVVKAEEGPQIVAAIVPEGTNLKALNAVLKAAGLDGLPVRTEGDGFISFAKADADKAEDTVVIKTGDKLALVVSGVKKAFDAYNGVTGFADKVKAQNYYSSYYTGQSILSDEIANSIASAATPADASKAVGSLIDEFKDYVTGLLSNLPQAAFFMDRAMYAPSMDYGCNACLSGPFDDYDDDDDSPIIIINKAAKNPKVTTGKVPGTNDIDGEGSEEANIPVPVNAKDSKAKKGAQPVDPGHGNIDGKGSEKPNIPVPPNASEDDGDDDELPVRNKKGDNDEEYDNTMKGKKGKGKKLPGQDVPNDDAVNSMKDDNIVDVQAGAGNAGDPTPEDNKPTDFQDPASGAPRKAKGPAQKEEPTAKNLREVKVFEKKDWSDKQRQDAAAAGDAMPDGSFPIKSKKDLKDAIGLAGNAKDPDAARRHIIGRANDLGAQDMVPDSWRHDGSSPAKKADEEVSAVLKASVSEIQKSVTAAVAGLAEQVRKQLADMSTRIEELGDQVQKADEALNGTIFLDAAGDRSKPVKKSAMNGHADLPLIDTGFARIA